MCTDCNDKFLNPQIGITPYCVDCAQGDQQCGQKFPAECTMYHLDTDNPSQLINLGLPNKTSVSTVLETIDKLLGTNFNLPINATNTKSIELLATGKAKHDLKANVKISGDIGNILQLKNDGLFVSPTEMGKVKVNANDTLSYLEDQLIGDTDGIISISTVTTTGLINIVPSLSVENLITDIRLNHLNSFNQLLTVSNNSNSNNVVNIQSKLAPFVAYAYHGSLTNFDNTGKGLVANGYDKVYICNGLNGTPDYRGRSPIGANVGVPGGTLDADVNPVNPEAISLTVNQKTGSYKERLTAEQLAAHGHTVNDPGHSHYTVAIDHDTGFIYSNVNNAINWTSEHHNGNQDYDLVGTTATPTYGITNTKSTGITINNNNSGGEYHNNTHPVVGTVFIMYIP